MHVSFNHVHGFRIHEVIDHHLHVTKNHERVENVLHEEVLTQIFQELMSFWIKDVSRVLYWSFLKVFLCVWSYHARPQGLRVVWKPFLFRLLPRYLQLARAKKWWLEPTFRALRILNSAEAGSSEEVLARASSVFAFCWL